MRGKNKCKILKEIRQKIADENDIPFVTQECTFQGECKGTCPKCEAELRYLEDQLAKRQRLGKTVTVAALAASLMANLTACPSNEKVDQKASDKLDGTFFAQATEANSDEFDGAPLPESFDSMIAGAAPIEGEPTETQWYEEAKGLIPTNDPHETEEIIYGDIDFSEAEETDLEATAGIIIDESQIGDYFELPIDGDE